MFHCYFYITLIHIHIHVYFHIYFNMHTFMVKLIDPLHSTIPPDTKPTILLKSEL